MLALGQTVDYARRFKIPVACYIEKEGVSSMGNEMLVQHKIAYALKDNEGMEYILELSGNRFEQQRLLV